MKTFFIALILTLPLTSSAFLLLDSNYRLAQPKDTVVNIAGNTCPNQGVSNEVVRVAIETAIEDYWNTVTESTLHLKLGGVVNKTTLAEVAPGEILVGCSSTAGNGGVTNPDNSRGTSIIFLDAQVTNLGFDRVVGVVVHELGHAIGLNHSGDPASVMTYDTHGWGLRPEYLADDDKNGVIYLYPQEGQASGLVPGCTTQASKRGKSFDQISTGIIQELLGLFFVFFLFKIFQIVFFRRAK